MRHNALQCGCNCSQHKRYNTAEQCPAGEFGFFRARGGEVQRAEAAARHEGKCQPESPEYPAQSDIFFWIYFSDIFGYILSIHPTLRSLSLSQNSAPTACASFTIKFALPRNAPGRLQPPYL